VFFLLAKRACRLWVTSCRLIGCHARYLNRPSQQNKRSFYYLPNSPHVRYRYPRIVAIAPYPFTPDTSHCVTRCADGRLSIAGRARP